MYSELQFKQAKLNYAYALLDDRKYNNKTDKVISDFIERISLTAAFNEKVTEDDVQRAIEYVIFLNNLYDENDDNRRLLDELRTIGYQYCGQLSPQQAGELRRVQILCLLVKSYEESAMKKLEDLLQ
jgi:hypothetical protein